MTNKALLCKLIMFICITRFVQIRYLDILQSLDSLRLRPSITPHLHLGLECQVRLQLRIFNNGAQTFFKNKMMVKFNALFFRCAH